MQFEDFWYIVAQSNQLRPNQVLSRMVLGEWLVVFRGDKGQPVVLRDRCIHRHSRLSPGKVHQGRLQCPYHGWTYDSSGQVVAVPAEGMDFKACAVRRTLSYPVVEQDGYIYVQLTEQPSEIFSPFSMPHYRQPGWETVRVINRFENSVSNCAENFIDIPHTASVHPGIFRTARQQCIKMTVERKQGTTIATYENETTNLGWFQRFLNWRGQEIRHIDRFYMPNITHVEYDISSHRHLFITSQSIPETDRSTLVYTDITYNYGIWNQISLPLVYWTAQRIIAQDIWILKIQGETITKYGTQFAHTPADTIHVFVESIRNAIAAGKDPRELPDKSVEVTFWV